MLTWNHPSPVFFDFETQSACDLKTAGGRLYAKDESTRLLTAVFLVDGTFHVWVPAHLGLTKTPRPVEIWPAQLGAFPAGGVVVWHADALPAPVAAAVAAGVPFVAHNTLGFDRFIWREKIGGPEPAWADTLPLSRAAGYPGRLETIAAALAGQGKDAGSRILKKLMTAQRTDDGYIYPSCGAGDLEAIARYNVADVELLRRVWVALDSVPVEADVLDAHDAINERGVRLDEPLAKSLGRVAAASVARAADRIKELTGGVLHSGNLRSVPQVNAWLHAQGLRIKDYRGKDTLRKDAVNQALANPWTMLDVEDDDVPLSAVDDIKPEVFEVLRLRGAALRITGSKSEKAVLRASADGRARDLFSYWQAHTGRWSSAGIQVHNLPRPRKGVPVDELLTEHAAGVWGGDGGTSYDHIAAKLSGKLTVDDAISGLLRPLFLPADGSAFVIADYAAIECRGVAWIAGEEGLLDTLASGGDVYKEMASRIFGVAVEDVTDAQRQVGKVTVLGCGYSMSAEKFRLYCGLQGIDLAAAGTTADACVEAFRGGYQKIAGTYAGQIDGKSYRTGGVWWQLNRAAFNAMQGGIHTAACTKWAFDGKNLICELPSGRCLRYRNARIEDRVPGYARALGVERTKATLLYDGNFGEAYLYGGKITENVVQALCRDLLASAIVECERAGLPVVLHVHDEIVCEVPAEHAEESLNTLATIMTTVPTWAAGFPIAVEGFAAPRYLKGAPKGWATVKRKSGKMC